MLLLRCFVFLCRRRRGMRLEFTVVRRRKTHGCGSCVYILNFFRSKKAIDHQRDEPHHISEQSGVRQSSQPAVRYDDTGNSTAESACGSVSRRACFVVESVGRLRVFQAVMIAPALCTPMVSCMSTPSTSTSPYPFFFLTIFFPAPHDCAQNMFKKVDALNWLTAQEPSGRWGLLRDVMEDKKQTKVCYNTFICPVGPNDFHLFFCTK